MCKTLLISRKFFNLPVMFLLSMVLIAIIGVFVINRVLTLYVKAKANIFTAQSTINNEEPF